MVVVVVVVVVEMHFTGIREEAWGREKERRPTHEPHKIENSRFSAGEKCEPRSQKL